MRQHRKSEILSLTKGVSVKTKRPHSPALDRRVLRGGRMTKWKGQVASYAPNLAQLAYAVASALRIVLLAALAASPALAADRYWDANQTATGSGGTGVWNLGNLFWSNNSSDTLGPYNQPWSNGDNAIFAGTAGTVTLGAPITANRLTFNTSGYTIGGVGANILTLGGVTPTITVNSGTSTISAVIAGTAGLTKAGAGTLTLTGVNSFTGGIVVNGGEVSVASDAALGNASNTVTLNDTTLTATGALSGSREVVLNGDVRISGAGVGSALFTGTGTLSIFRSVTMNNDANTYTGTTITNGFGTAGTVRFTSVRNTGFASSLGAGGEVIFRGTNVYTGVGDTTDRTVRFQPSANASAGLINSGTGDLALTGAISFEGGPRSAFLSADTADLDVSGTISGTNTATVSYTGGGTARTITLGEANTYTGANSIGTVTLAVSSLADRGAASSLGTNDNTGAGLSDIQINNGVLDYQGDGDSSNRTWEISNNSSVLNNGTGALALSGAVTFDPVGSIDTLTLGGGFANSENSISGDIMGTGRIIKNGAGTWVLSGNDSYTGTTTVENGTLRAGSATAFNQLSSVTVNGGTFDLGGYDYSFTGLDGSGGTVELGAGDLTVNVATGGSSSYGGSIQGSGGFTKLGGGTQTLTGASTYTGATDLAGGTLALDFTPAGAPASNIISSASTLNMAGGTMQVIGAAGEANSQTFNSLNITAGSNRVTAAAGASGGTVLVNFGGVARTGGQIDFGIGAGTTMTVAPGTTLGGWATVNGSDYADVDASNNIVAFTDYDLEDDAGTWSDGDIVTDTGGAANTPFFGTASDAGGDDVVQLGGLRYTVPRNSGINVGAGQTLGVDGTIIIASSVGGTSQTITGGSVRGAAGGALGIQQNSAGTFTINSTIVDNGSATGLNVGGIGTGNAVLGNAANTYTGATWITRGRLSVATLANGGVVSSIGASSANSSNLVLEGGTLNYTGGSATTDRGFTVMRSGAITGGTIQVTQSSTNLTFGGEIVSPDGAGLTKTGAGTLTLTNADSSYTGVTRIDAGTLAVSKITDGGANSSIGASSSDSANLVLNGGELAYIGGTDASNRGFTLQSASRISVTDAGTTLTLSGTATGSGGFYKNGAGTLMLAGTNNFTGDVRVNDGVLRAGSTQAFGTGVMTVSSATLDLAGFSNSVAGLVGTGDVLLGTGTLTISHGLGSTFSGAISGLGGLTKSGAGAQALTGCGNDYTGPTTVSGGRLSVDCIRNGGVASSIGASGAAAANLVLSNDGVLQYTGGTVTTNRGFHIASGWGAIDVTDAAATLEFTGNVTNAAGGSLGKYGPGTLKLSGTNTFSSTLVGEGTLIAGSSRALGSGSLAIRTGAIVDMTGFSNTVQSLGDNGTTGGELHLGAQTLTLTGANAAFAGRITGTTGSIDLNAGNQTLSGCDNSYGGSTIINGGWLSVACLNNGDVNSSIGSSSADASNLVIGGTAAAGMIYIGTGGSTDRRFTMGNTAYIRNNGTGAISFASTAAVTQTGTGTRQLRLGGTNTGTNILAAQIVDNGVSAVSLVKEEAGTWRLTSATSNYTGATTISPNGVLEVVKLANGGVASSIGASTAIAGNLLINTNARLRYVGTGDSTNRLFTLGTGTTLIESSGTGAVNFTDSGGLMGFAGTGARTFTLGGTYAGDNVMGVTIRDQSGTAQTSLAKNDAGTWILTANNTYTGNTVINDGKLIIGNGGTVGNVGTGDVILAFSTGTLGFNRSDTFSFAGQISGPGIIEQMGEGTTVLTASNSAGVTRITEGALQVDGTLTTDTITFEDDEATTLTVNGTVTGNGVPAVVTGDGLSNIINVNGGGVLTATGDLGGGGDTVNVSGTLDTGAGVLGLGQGNDTLVLNDTAVFSGGGVDAGTGGESGAGDTLRVVANSTRTLDGADVTNFESLIKGGSGILILTGDHSYSAGTTIESVALRLGDGSTLATPTVENSGSLTFYHNNDYTFSGVISGTGSVSTMGFGTVTLTGDNSYAGTTNINQGTLIINGDQSGAQGQTSVGIFATLGGNGTVGGDLTVLGTISPGAAGNSPDTLTVNGNVTLFGPAKLNYDFGQADVAGGPLNDLINVGGNLTLDGTLNVTQTPGGTFGPGVYRIFNYGGDLTDNGLNVADPAYFVQTSVDKQVNLVNSAGLTLSYWDGDAGPHSNGMVNGGDGIWQAAGGQNWTDATGLFAAPFDNASFAIFQGAAGLVDVDSTTNGQVQAVGMQFATDGYVVQGEGIVLVDDSTQTGLQSIIRVGDGTAVGTGYVATISSDLSGSTQLVKADLGTLVLSGTNSYTAGTAINGGTVEVSADINLGAAAGALSLDGGTLHNTAAFASARAVTLGVGGGTFEIDADLALNGVIGGAGALTKVGGATLVLAGTNSYQGGTVINGGTIEVSANANLGNASGTLTLDGGTLRSTAIFTTARNVTLNAAGGTFDTNGGTALTLASAVTGAGDLAKGGAGTLVLAATNTYGGGTTISDGTLQLGNGGTAGSITGDVLNDGMLAFNRSNSYTFAGLISGSGAIEQIGGGTTILTADNSYTDETFVREGTLIVNGDQAAASGMTTVEDGGVLGGIGTIGGDVAVLDGGALNPGNPGTAPGTLTINGSLALDPNATLNYNFGQAGVVGGAYNDLTIVQGDFTLDGTINVAETPGGNFGPGIYRVISYGGTLTNLGLSESSPDHVVQTSMDGQVNLVDISSMTLNFWDGDAGPKDDDLVEGGSGTWRAAGDDNWTDDTGSINAAFSNGSFAIFGGAAGTVDVDNSNGQVAATGMQFATGGYLIQGDAITLDGTQATIRVGDGTAPGAGYVATIASVLQGDAQLVKRDLGTLGADRHEHLYRRHTHPRGNAAVHQRCKPRRCSGWTHASTAARCRTPWPRQQPAASPSATPAARCSPMQT